MIHGCLQFLATQVNAHLSAEAVLPIRCCPIQTGDGKWNSSPSLSVINVEEDRITREQELERSLGSGFTCDFSQPPIKLNLQLLFAIPCRADESDPAKLEAQYLESLRLLSLVVAFFQTVPRFTADRFPQLAEFGIERVAMELLTLTSEQMNQIWSCIGTRYMPSAVYRLRLLRLSGTAPPSQQSLISQANVLVGGGA